MKGEWRLDLLCWWVGRKVELWIHFLFLVQDLTIWMGILLEVDSGTLEFYQPSYGLNGVSGFFSPVVDEELSSEVMGV